MAGELDQQKENERRMIISMEIILASGLLSLVVTSVVMAKVRADIIKYVDEMDEISRETIENVKDITLRAIDDFVKRLGGR